MSALPDVDALWIGRTHATPTETCPRCQRQAATCHRPAGTDAWICARCGGEWLALDVDHFNAPLDEIGRRFASFLTTKPQKRKEEP